MRQTSLPRTLQMLSSVTTKKKLVWDKANVENEINQELDQSKNQQEGC